jgi:hypothetical protein
MCLERMGSVGVSPLINTFVCYFSFCNVIFSGAFLLFLCGFCFAKKENIRILFSIVILMASEAWMDFFLMAVPGFNFTNIDAWRFLGTGKLKRLEFRSLAFHFFPLRLSNGEWMEFG